MAHWDDDACASPASGDDDPTTLQDHGRPPTAPPHLHRHPYTADEYSSHVIIAFDGFRCVHQGDIQPGGGGGAPKFADERLVDLSLASHTLLFGTTPATRPARPCHRAAWMPHDKDSLRPHALAVRHCSQQLKEAGTIFPFLGVGNGHEPPARCPRIIRSSWSAGRRGSRLEAKVSLDRRAGTALLDVHPTYMRFSGDGSKKTSTRPPSTRSSWNTSARRIRTSTANCRGISPGSGRPAMPEKRSATGQKSMPACSPTPSTTSTTRADALRGPAKAGDDVDAIALREKGQPDFNVVRRQRIPDSGGSATRAASWTTHLDSQICREIYRFPYRKHWKNPYQLIHATVPDFEVFATVLAS